MDSIVKLPKQSYSWSPEERDKVEIKSQTETSATIRLLHSGTTVVNYNYKYNSTTENRQNSVAANLPGKGGSADSKTKDGAYPFTIKIARAEPNAMFVPKNIEIGWGMTTNISRLVKYTPEFAEAALMFSTDNSGIIEQSSDKPHIFKGLALGETDVQVHTSNGLSGVVHVKVVVPQLASIEIIKPDENLTQGKKIQLSYRITPLHAAPKICWKSDSPDVISVDDEGMITAKSQGKAKITIITDNGKKDSITLKVK